MNIPLLLLTNLSALALSFTVPKNLIEKELAEADVVVEIKIVSQKVAPSNSSHPINTLSTATVLKKKLLKNNIEIEDTIEIETVGGEADGHGVFYSGLPRPRLGESYLAYLKKNNPTYFVKAFEFGLRPLYPTRTYSRNRTDGSNGSGSGSFLYWDNSYFPLTYLIAAETFKGHSDYVKAIDLSFKTWRETQTTKIDFLPMGCSTAIKNENDGINNIILITENWPFESAAIALTRNFYVADNSTRSGMILDSDILLNGVNYSFTTTNQSDQYDLQNILTHEIGHFLGFGHEVSPFDTESTMYAVADPNETKKQTLQASEIAALHEAYYGQTQKDPYPASLCSIKNSNTGCLSAHKQSSSSSNSFYILFSLFLILTMGVGRKIIRRLL